MVGPRSRVHLRRPFWGIIALACMAIIVLFAAFTYLPSNKPQNAFSRTLTDFEVESRVVIEEIMKLSLTKSKNPKIAFMFLTAGTLPFEKLWHLFFQVWHSYSFMSTIMSINAIFYFPSSTHCICTA